MGTHATGIWPRKIKPTVGEEAAAWLDSPLDQATFLRHTGILIAAFPARSAAGLQADGLLAALEETLMGATFPAGDRLPGEPTTREWLTNAVYIRAKRLILEELTDWLPAPAAVLDYCRRAAEQLRREHTKALPAPTPSTTAITQEQYPREKWDRNIAIGKARQRKRIAWILAYREANGVPAGGSVPRAPLDEIQPTEREVDAVLREMDAAGQLAGTLDAALRVRVPIDLSDR